MTTPTDTVATFTEGAKAGRKLIRGTKGADVQLSVDWGYVKITAKEALAQLAGMDDTASYDVSVSRHVTPATDEYRAYAIIFVHIAILW